MFDNEQTANAVDQLVGAGKKYATIEDLAKSRLAADEHISRIEKENDQFRTDLRARETIESMLQKLTPAPRQPDVSDQGKQQGAADQGSFKLEDVEKLLNQREQTKSRESNLAKAKSISESLYGPDYNTKLKGVASTLGVGTDFLMDVAAKSPEGFEKLVTSVAKPDKPAPIIPGTTGNPPQEVDGTKNWDFYKKLRKENPELYNSRRVQSEIMSQAMKMGESFFN